MCKCGWGDVGGPVWIGRCGWEGARLPAEGEEHVEGLPHDVLDGQAAPHVRVDRDVPVVAQNEEAAHRHRQRGQVVPRGLKRVGLVPARGWAQGRAREGAGGRGAVGRGSVGGRRKLDRYAILHYYSLYYTDILNCSTTLLFCAERTEAVC
jgi:hypothetical protein